MVVFEPGTLDRTRKNIGDVDPIHAKALQEKLGGEIGLEKSRPTERSIAASTAPLLRHTPGTPAQSTDVKPFAEVTRQPSPGKTTFTLPTVSPRERDKMDRVMMSKEYRIKMNYGIFNWFVFLFTKRTDTVSPAFIRISMGNAIFHMESLAKSVRELQDASPELYKKKITEAENTKFQMLRKISSWTFTEINRQYAMIKNGATPVTIIRLIPLIKAVYKYLLSVYFLGERRGAAMLQSILDDFSAYSDIDTAKMAALIRQIEADWIYLFKNCAQRMYPLLMRMCCTHYFAYPDFFAKEITAILAFLAITKYDLVLPQKSDKDKNISSESETPESAAENAAKQESAATEAESKAGLVNEGLKLLDQLFPGAGWLQLAETMPDFYPYFQPLFSFHDGFALLAPDNPIQKIVVLLFILEDLFRGCRSIKFLVDTESDPRLHSKGDSLALALDEWRVYQDLVFEKRYASDMRDLVEHLYTQEGFIHSPLGKKMIFNLLWQMKFFYLPHFTFVAIGKPQYDFAYRPLCARAAFVGSIFAVLSERIDAAVKTRAEVQGIRNPWEPYVFDISNEVSKRLDALSRVQKKSFLDTNANIVKSVAAVLAVLDWWINDASSPAYRSVENVPIYRTLGGVGSMPSAPPPVRNDQDTLFRQSLDKLGSLH